MISWRRCRDWNDSIDRLETTLDVLSSFEEGHFSSSVHSERKSRVGDSEWIIYKYNITLQVQEENEKETRNKSRVILQWIVGNARLHLQSTRFPSSIPVVSIHKRARGRRRRNWRILKPNINTLLLTSEFSIPDSRHGVSNAHLIQSSPVHSNFFVTKKEPSFHSISSRRTQRRVKEEKTTSPLELVRLFSLSRNCELIPLLKLPSGLDQKDDVDFLFSG